MFIKKGTPEKLNVVSTAVCSVCKTRKATAIIDNKFYCEECKPDVRKKR